jgi:dihydropteroate synthase
LSKTLVMGILNVNGDSFYAPSRASDTEDALRRALILSEEEADILDIGAESTRPGSHGIDASTETALLLPVVEAARRELPEMPISVDTRKASVAKLAIEAGADIINDVSGLELPEESHAMARMLASTGAVYVLMHTTGTPDVMQSMTRYDDLIPDIANFFREKLIFLENAGVSRDKIIIDPGLGFGKTISDNMTIIAEISRFFEFGLPVLIGASRKKFVGGEGRTDPSTRLEGTIAISALCARAGVDILRVHDAAANRRAVEVADAVRRHAR